MVATRAHGVTREELLSANLSDADPGAQERGS